MNSGSCANCNATDSIANPVETHMIDGAWTPMCDECMGELERIERRADELAAKPGCAERERIIDTAQSAEELVNRAMFHDMRPCAGCAAAVLPEAA